MTGLCRVDCQRRWVQRKRITINMYEVSWWIVMYTYLNQFSSVAHSCPTLHNPMDHSTPGLPVHHQLLESTQTHVHWVSRWCHPTISSSVIPFSSCPQSFPASRSFQMSQLFASGGQSIGVSASASACGKS